MKLRSKSNAHRKKSDLQRTPLDLPTTDPGLDLQFSTDDEQYADARQLDDNGYTTVTRNCRYLLHSELQRRYIEEIGDGSNILKRGPPQLMISSPTAQNVMITYKPAAPKTAPAEKIIIGEFPQISGLSRRTNSWHNLNNGGKCTPKLKAQSPFQSNNPFDGQTKEDLAFRLSLRKQIWTGVKPENPSKYTERNRPLSWAMPMFGTISKRETLLATPNQVFKTDANELLFNACSQKLLAWQHATMFTPNKQKSKLTLNLVIPDISNEQKTLRIFKQLSQMPSTQKPSKLESKDIRLKRKKNSLSKVADTTQLISRLAKNKSNSILTAQRQLKATTPSNSSQKLLKHGGNKFKTNGIVVAAVQSNSPKNTRTKLRAITTNVSTAFHASTVRTTRQTDMVMPGSAAAAYGNSINLDIRAAMETSTFVRKVKTKLKKKSKTSNMETTGLSRAAAGSGMGAVGRGVTKKLN